MPIGLKVAIVFNVIATALIGVLALGIGGGFELAVFPPDHQISSHAARTSRVVPSQAVVAGRDEAPREAGAYDLTAPRWEIRPDGSLRILDDPRDLALASDSALRKGTVPQTRTSIHQVEEVHQ